MSASPTTMMVSVPQFRGLQVQHCTVSLPRVDALLDDPDTRYFVAVERREAASVSSRDIVRQGRRALRRMSDDDLREARAAISPRGGSLRPRLERSGIRLPALRNPPQ